MSGTAAHPVFARVWAKAGPRAVAFRDRRELLAGLEGAAITEIGVGAGTSFPFYPPAVASLLAVEPEPYLRALAAEAAADAPFPVQVADGTAAAIPAADGSMDAVVTCLVLCSVPDQAAALAEVRRVLRPGGELRFFEHVVAERRAPALLQAALDRSRVWPTIGAGCHLGHDTGAAIRAAGFRVERSRRFVTGPWIPHVTGVARRD